MVYQVKLISRIVTPELNELRVMGYTKNHKRLDVFAVGKWRIMGYFQGEKALERLYENSIQKISINTGLKTSDIIIVREA